MMRVNLFRPVHVKTLMSQKRRALLNARKLLQAYSATIDIPARFRNSKAVGPGRTNNADSNDQMVMAQGLGDEHCQAARYGTQFRWTREATLAAV
jgi:hypothetical protein